MTKARLVRTAINVRKPGGGGSYRSHRNKRITPAASEIKGGPTAGPITPAQSAAGPRAASPSLIVGAHEYGRDLRHYDYDSLSGFAEAHRERGATISRMTAEQQTSILGSNSAEVLAQLAEHTTVEEILDGLAEHGDADVRAAVRARTEWNEERLDRIDTADMRGQAEVAARRAALYPQPPRVEPLTAVGTPADEAGAAIGEAGDPGTRPWRLTVLAEHDHDFVIEAVVENPNTPTAALEKLAARTPIAALYAARRSDCSPELLASQAESEAPAIRAAVAAHAGTPAAALRELARDGDRDVREALAANPSTPRAALKLLSDGGGSRAATAAHRRLRDE
jgi:hypothetical protein